MDERSAIFEYASTVLLPGCCFLFFLGCHGTLHHGLVNMYIHITALRFSMFATRSILKLAASATAVCCATHYSNAGCSYIC